MSKPTTNATSIRGIERATLHGRTVHIRPNVPNPLFRHGKARRHPQIAFRTGPIAGSEGRGKGAVR
jgi:hypothetical protein